MVEDSCDQDSFLRDYELSLIAVRKVCETLRLELLHENDEAEAIEQEFNGSLSYRLGSFLCRNFHL